MKRKTATEIMMEQQEKEGKIRVQLVADKCKIAMYAAAPLFPYLQDLKSARDSFQEALSHWNAIGIMDPRNYEYKRKDMECRIDRLDALINFVEVLQKTDFDMNANKKEQKERARTLNVLQQICGL